MTLTMTGMKVLLAALYEEIPNPAYVEDFITNLDTQLQQEERDERSSSPGTSTYARLPG